MGGRQRQVMWVLGDSGFCPVWGWRQVGGGNHQILQSRDVARLDLLFECSLSFILSQDSKLLKQW